MVFQTPWEFFHENVPTTNVTVFSSLDDLKEVSVELVFHVISRASEWPDRRCTKLKIYPSS